MAIIKGVLPRQSCAVTFAPLLYSSKMILGVGNEMDFQQMAATSS
jgi:hypothetical protein